jgi:dGTP triphosphohydrolase
VCDIIKKIGYLLSLNEENESYYKNNVIDISERTPDTFFESFYPVIRKAYLKEKVQTMEAFEKYAIMFVNDNWLSYDENSQEHKDYEKIFVKKIVAIHQDIETKCKNINDICDKDLSTLYMKMISIVDDGSKLKQKIPSDIELIKKIVTEMKNRKRRNHKKARI